MPIMLFKQNDLNFINQTGLGLCAVLTTTFICIYYNVIISYCLIYAISSFLPNLPWLNCDNWWNNEKCFVSGANSTNLITDKSKFDSPSKQFF